MDVRPQPTTKIRDIRAKRLRLKVLKALIPEMERSLVERIHEKASLEAIIIKVEAYELAKNHDGLCGEVGTCRDCSGIDPESCMGGCEDGTEKCGRFYGHTGLHSWEGGGIG